MLNESLKGMSLNMYESLKTCRSVPNLRSAFNSLWTSKKNNTLTVIRVDRERLKLVGPDCACAEWLLRNGASVRFRGQPTLLSDYNELIEMEETGVHHLKVEEVYARNADLNSLGFNHFKDCRYVKKATFIFCSYIYDSALVKLNYLKNSLEYLEMRSCFNIQDKGLNSLHDLSNLKTLILADLVSVKNKDQCEAALRNALPQCDIQFTK